MASRSRELLEEWSRGYWHEGVERAASVGGTVSYERAVGER